MKGSGGGGKGGYEGYEGGRVCPHVGGNGEC